MKNKLSLNFILCVGILAAIILSLRTGAISLNWLNAFQDTASKDFSILLYLRLPRTLLALLAGGTLGICGAAMQGYLKNPLAEPGTLGVTGGATLGAVITIYFGLSSQWIFALPLAGLIGAFTAMLFMIILAPKMTTFSLILAGIAFNAFALALTSVLLNLAPNPFSVLEMLFWQMGSVANRSWQHILVISPFIAMGIFLLVKAGRSLDVLALGDDTAETLGVNRKKLSLVILFGTALSVGAIVSICGAISFVGLVVPHLLRPFVGYSPKRLLPVSFLGGALLLLIADILVSTIPLGTELKIGVVTSFIGAPFFLFLLFKTKRTFR